MLTMFTGGLIGNFSVLHLLAQNLTLHANYYRKENAPPFSAKDFAPDFWNFVEPPPTKEQEAHLTQERLSMLGGIPPSAMLEIIQRSMHEH